MAESILKLRVESSEYDSKLKRAAQGLQQYADQCRKAGGTLEVVEKDTLDFVKALGRMETTSKTARGSLNEMTKTFTDLKMQYKQLTDAEKASPYGKALNESLNQLKSRIKETQNELKSINQELQGGNGKFGQFGSILDGIGQKMDINANITELLTSRTALLTGAIGASATAVVAATKAWADYNAEIAKQQQITTVTTGLKGDDADRMTAAARALSKTYNVDFREAINAANTIMSQFGKTGDETIQLLRDGMRGMINGDGGKLLSMIQQYAPSFRDAGVSASQLVAVIQNSEGGIFTDQNMNAIVMGIKNIRLMTKSTSDALAQLGIDGKSMTKALNEGTLSIFDALKQVMGQLQKVESGSQTAGEVLQRVFGRQGAAAGTNLAKAIETLNLNLEETKQQTGEVGKSFDELYNANVRLEKALQKTFGYKGWEEMANGIKTMLVTAMAEVLEKVNKINQSFETNFGVSFFDGIFNAATNAIGPMGKVLQAIRDINKEKAVGGSGSGSSELDDAFKYIKSGTDRAEREKRYDSQLSDINKRLADIGQEKTRKNADGSTSFYIDDPAEQQRQRTQLLNQRTQLVLNRDKLLSGQSNQVTQITPIVPEPKNTKGGTKTQKTEEQLNSEQIQKLTQEYIKASDDRRKAIEAEIKGLQQRNEEIKKLTDIAQGKIAPEGSEDALKEQLKNLQAERGKLSDPIEIEIQDQQIKEVQDEIDRLNGKKVEVELEANGLSSFEQLQQSLKIKIAEQNMEVDTNTLQTLMKTAIQNGIDGLDPNFSALQEKMREGMNIPDETWQALQDQINEKLKGLGIKPIQIDFSTGNVKKQAKEMSKDWQSAAQAVQAVGSAMASIEDPAAKVVGTVAQAIASIALGYSQATVAAAQNGNPWAWVAFAATGMAQMVSMISAIHSATGYAQGGMIKGNSYSGDNIGGLVDGSQLVGLNAGEVVLNASQQSMLAGNLQGSGGGKMEIVGVLTGENVVLMADRWGRRTGRGELLFGKDL